MKCIFCGADVRINQKCEYCGSIAEPSYYPGFKQIEYETHEKTKSTSEPLDQKIYIVQRGDTLWSIATKFYGDGLQNKKILDANSTIKDPNKIYVGQKLKIPV